MDSASRLRRLFDYDVWATLKVLAVLEDHSSFEWREKVLDLFFHILGAQELWYRRVTGKDLSNIEVWPEYRLEECRSLIQTKHENWKMLIKEEEDNLDRIISYKNSKGVAYESMLSDIMHHLIIHGQHHRAQIATLLRMSGIAPPPTDFIFFTRQ